MQKRTKAGQRRHDKAVLGSAKWYENQGFRVDADLPSYDKPKTIGGYIPDWIARKGKKEILGEVETLGTNEKDKAQQEAFKKYTERKAGREFKKRII